MRKTLAVAAASLALGLASCRPAYDTQLTTKQVMDEVIDPAWQTYTHSSGFVDDRDLTPTTDAGWKAAGSAASDLVEAGNLLILPGRSKGGDWNREALAMSRVALEARAAVRARDSKRMFDVGGRLYQACTDCHQEYQLPLLDKAQN